MEKEPTIEKTREQKVKEGLSNLSVLIAKIEELRSSPDDKYCQERVDLYIDKLAQNFRELEK